jgi:hypothetical protein
MQPLGRVNHARKSAPATAVFAAQRKPAGNIRKLVADPQTRHDSMRFEPSLYMG